MPTFRLGDDGTLDTVVVCEECGEELRYNYDPTTEGDDDEGHAEQRYRDFVAWALEDAEADHECGACPTCGTVHPAHTCREGE